MNLLVKTNSMDNAKKIWWDIRPHPFFDTVEVRICDIPLRAEESLAIAALIQATAVKLYRLHARNIDFRQYSRALLMENKWRAVRYGLDGKLIDFGKEIEVPERDLIREYLEFVEEVVENWIHAARSPTSTTCSRQAQVRTGKFASSTKTKTCTRSSITWPARPRQACLTKPAAPQDEARPASILDRVLTPPVSSSTAGVPEQALLATRFPPDLSPGAHAAVTACLRVEASEKVTLIADRSTLEIAAALAQELEAAGCRWSAFVLEDVATRPLTDMPAAVLEDMETSDVSIFAVNVQQRELHSRMQMTDVVNRRRMRHAHMVNITPQIMREGMRADFARIDRLSQQLVEIVRDARWLRATTAAGTDIRADLSPAYKWLKTSGIISRDKWGNLPGGEIFTSPGEVNGVFVVDGVVGDYLCAKYGLLRATPLTIEIAKNRIVSCESDDRELREDFWAYTHTDENSDRVGEFAIGTNIGVHEVIGNILQDEKFPGIHIAFGNPYGEHTGAKWFSSTHIDVVGLGFNIWAEDLQIMQAGRFLLEY